MAKANMKDRKAKLPKIKQTSVLTHVRVAEKDAHEFDGADCEAFTEQIQSVALDGLIRMGRTGTWAVDVSFRKVD